MAYFPDVTKGEQVKPSALLENCLRHMVNSLDGFGDNAPKGSNSGLVRIQVWNSANSTIAAGSPVSFDAAKNMVDGALPVKKVADPTKPFGVLPLSLEKKAMGDCIVSGPCMVKIGGGSGDYAEPVANSDRFKLATSGTARVLCRNGNKAMVILGVGTSDYYNGPFSVTYDSETGKVKIAAGYISTNGIFSAVPSAEIDPQTGILCCYSEIGEDGVWTKPVIQYATPNKYNYPIGSVSVEGSGDNASVSVSCYRVPVAVIIDAAECPVSAEADTGAANGN